MESLNPLSHILAAFSLPVVYQECCDVGILKKGKKKNAGASASTFSFSADRVSEISVLTGLQIQKRVKDFKGSFNEREILKERTQRAVTL